MERKYGVLPLKATLRFQNTFSTHLVTRKQGASIGNTHRLPAPPQDDHRLAECVESFAGILTALRLSEPPLVLHPPIGTATDGPEPYQ